MLLHEDECHEVYNLILLRVMSSSSTQDLQPLTIKIYKAGEDLAQFPFFPLLQLLFLTVPKLQQIACKFPSLINTN